MLLSSSFAGTHLCASVLIAFATASLTSAQTYTFGQGILAAGTQPVSIATGDFDGDGSLDLVVANRSDNMVSVYLSRKDGTFRSPVNYPTGPQPSSVAVGDFNGDGNLDLVVTNENCTIPARLPTLQCSPASVSILLGNGDGTFQPQEQFPTALRPLSVKAVDLNGDGKLDLVVGGNLGQGNNPVSVLLGNGDGTFQDHVDYSSPNGGANWVVVGDFNGDGKLDIATNSGSGVAIYLGVGDGTFQGATTFQLHDQVSGNSGAVAGDFNGDGKLDLAVTTSSGVDIFLGNGDGTFAFKAVFPGAQGQIVAVDLNQDGKLDLVGTSEDPQGNGWFISVLVGNGDGTFQPPLSQATGLSPSALATGDFNGDGLVDVAVTVVNSTISEPAQGDPVPATGPYGSVVVFLGAGNGALGFPPIAPIVSLASPTNFLPASMKAVDLNGDTKLDLVFLSSGANTVSVLLGNGDGTFHAQQDFATGTLPVALQVADLNGDGKPDLVVVNQVCLFNASICASGSVSVLLGNGDGTFQPHVDYAVGVTPMSVAIADFNGDGKPDLAVTNANLGLGNTISILTGKGDGTFNPHVDQMVVPEPGPIVAADFNHDGKIDLAVGCADVANTNPCPAAISISILLGNGDATFQRHDFLSNSPTFPHGPRSFVVADFNADGNPDLAVGGFSGAFAVFLGKGDGTFELGGSGQGLNIGNELLAVGDFDADGKLDIALPQDTPRVVLYHGNGDGTFQPSQQLLLPGGITFDDPVPASGDFNSDSSLDLAVMEPGSSTLSIILNNPFKSVFPSSLAFGSQGVGLSSVVRTITIGNPSVTPFHISSVAATGPYSQNNNCSATVLPGETCTINVTFMPVGAGPVIGTITLTDSTHSSPQFIPLTGTGINGPFLEFSSTHLTLASTAVGGTSASRAVTLTNSGNAPLALSNIAVTGANAGDFHESNTCGSTLAPAATCSASVTFAPSAGGTRLAALTVTDNASGSPHSVILSAITLSPQPTLSVAALTFSGQDVGSTSPSQNVTLKNVGLAALSLGQIATSGDFAQTNNCGTSVAAGSSCQISVTFTPTAAGSRTGSLSVADGASSGPQTVALTGTGQDFTISAGTMNSATVAAGQTATYSISLSPSGGFSQTVSLSCTGAPSLSTCNVSPSSVTLNGTSATSATVTVSTTAPAIILPLEYPRIGSPRTVNFHYVFPLMVSLALALMASLGKQRRERDSLATMFLLILLLCTGITFAACSGGGSASVTPKPGTQPGNYSLTVSGSFTSGSTTLAHSTKLTLVVQ